MLERNQHVPVSGFGKLQCRLPTFGVEIESGSVYMCAPIVASNVVQYALDAKQQYWILRVRKAHISVAHAYIYRISGPSQVAIRA